MGRSDEEEVELLKRLWHDYGKSTVAAVAIVLVGVFGHKAYKNNQQEAIEESSRLYQSLQDTVQTSFGQPLSEEQLETVKHVTATLQADFDSSIYSVLASFLLAKEQVTGGDLEGARGSLEWVLSQKTSKESQTLASIRLARVLLAISSDNATEALNLLDAVTLYDAFAATVESVRGDAYMVLGERDQARTAYQKAVDAAEAAGKSRPMLQFKLDDLATGAQEE